MGCSFERLVLPGDRMTIRDLVDWLQRRDARGVAAFCEPERLRAALDGRMVPLDTFSGSAGELAIFPPVTGG